MRKCLFISASISLVLIIMLGVFFYPHSTLITLERAFTRANIQEELIISSGQFLLEPQKYSPIDLEKKLKHLSSALSLHKITISSSPNPFGSSGQLVGFLTSGSRVVLKADSWQYAMAGQKKQGTRLRFELYSKEFKEKEKNFLTRVQKLAKNRKKELLISTCILGTIHGKLDEGQRRSLKGRIFQAVSAQENKVINYNQMSTFLGYTPWIFQSLFSRGEKTNFQLVVRYNRNSDSTIILLGSPIIDIDY